MSEENQVEDMPQIAEETMLGDLRDCILDTFKHERDIKPWKEMSEEEQRNLAARIETRCRFAIAEAVRMIAANGFHTIKGELEKVTIKDSYQCVINVSKHIEQRHALADAAGNAVLITVADVEQFMGADEADIDPDQPDLPVADNAQNIPQEEAA
jgi:hypothetical protein